jgi:hypothetical protein
MALPIVVTEQMNPEKFVVNNLISFKKFQKNIKCKIPNFFPGESPCDGKLNCDDGRCISKKVCCDKYYDANCTATYEIPCCGKLLNFLAPDFPLQTHHQFHEIGFLQSTMYTIIGIVFVCFIGLEAFFFPLIQCIIFD